MYDQARVAVDQLRGELREQCVAAALYCVVMLLHVTRAVFLRRHQHSPRGRMLRAADSLFERAGCRFKLLAQRRFEENERNQQHERQCDAPHAAAGARPLTRFCSDILCCCSSLIKTGDCCSQISSSCCRLPIIHILQAAHREAGQRQRQIDCSHRRRSRVRACKRHAALVSRDVAVAVA
jgi:hypothetical protein